MPLKQLFDPKSVCLIGSSKKKERGNLISSEIFKKISHNLRSFFKGKSSIVDLEERKKLPKSDLYVLSLPEKRLLKLVKKFNCKACIILPGNYSKKKLLLRKMERKNIRFLGPNSVCGVINSHSGLNTTFESGNMPEKGDFSIVCQSGGVGASLLDLAVSSFVGINKLIWLGDAWDVSFPEVVRYLSKDRKTKSIGLYVEGIEDGLEFVEAVDKIKKPIVALKGGSSKEGAKRALTHTSSLSGSARIYSSAFKQSRIVEVQTVEELYETTHALSKRKRMKGNRVAIVSNMGGPAILAADYARKFGLKLPEFDRRTMIKIKRKYPWIHPINPLDLVADADEERYEFCLKEVMKDKNVDAILLVSLLKSCTLTPEETRSLAKISKKSRKPIINCVPAREDWEKIGGVMNSEGVYVFDNLERSVKTLRALHDYNKLRRR